MAVKRYELSEVRWTKIASLLPGKAGDMIDSMIVRAHQQAASRKGWQDQALRRSRGG